MPEVQLWCRHRNGARHTHNSGGIRPKAQPRLKEKPNPRPSEMTYNSHEQLSSWKAPLQWGWEIYRDAKHFGKINSKSIFG